MKNAGLRTITRDGITVSFINEEEFEALWHEIFENNQYNFSCKTSAPFIIDCGANIGISILYFKQCYPYSHILAFEPNPNTFHILELNIEQNHIHNVQLINAAVGENDGKIPFYVRQDSTITGGDTCLKAAIIGEEQQWQSIFVNVTRLSSYITRYIDYLKLDIEGMENIVLREIEHRISLIAEIRIEFHNNTKNKANNLNKVLHLFEKYNFKYAFERDRRVIGINKIRHGMKHIDPYQFIIYTHRSRRKVWWQSWFVPKLLRVRNRLRRRIDHTFG